MPVYVSGENSPYGKCKNEKVLSCKKTILLFFDIGMTKLFNGKKIIK
jgi:hypothetical protein